eukprot:TRINITY_DN1415_c0_g1::TRINITY_DN1415_c0_g1_i1::g.27264::m.27264 TRINITY_DN1415_c0_g1::TRINITY_DN1415_c0_g1_i1::g.27264  ORF type:complete len:141 (-),score=41.43,sp/Q43644/NDUS1_SOLTU/56.25/3e-06,DUF1982/PF09326.6/1.3e-12 TRINITY_DN1415_c0_g1_i1:200-589(-)
MARFLTQPLRRFFYSEVASVRQSIKDSSDKLTKAETAIANEFFKGVQAGEVHVTAPQYSTKLTPLPTAFSEKAKEIRLFNELNKGNNQFFLTPFVPTIHNFYQTDPITRSSQTMARCTVVIKKRNFKKL